MVLLEGKKDLGIHTEMISDGVLDLVDLGVVNGSKKNINPGSIVTYRRTHETLVCGRADDMPFSWILIDISDLDYMEIVGAVCTSEIFRCMYPNWGTFSARFGG